VYNRTHTLYVHTTYPTNEMTIEEHVISAAASAVGGLAAVCSLIVMVTFVLFRSLRSPTRVLITCLSFCDFGQGIFFLFITLPASDDYTEAYSSSCKVLAIFGIWMALASFLWTICIAVYLYRSMRYPMQSAYRFIKLFHAVSWGYPTVYAILLCMNNSILSKSPTQPWCFVSENYPVWRLVSLYLPLVLTWSAVTVLYSLTKAGLKTLRRFSLPIRNGQSSDLELVSHTQQRDAELNEVQSKLVFVPIIFTFLRMWGIAYRGLTFSNVSDVSE